MAIKKKAAGKAKGDQTAAPEAAKPRTRKRPPADAQPVEAHAAAPLSPDGFPIVGIGASAGGLAAFEAFFSGMPIDVDPDMAFVLVQHLAPDHKSILADLIQRGFRSTRNDALEGVDDFVDLNQIHDAIKFDPLAPRQPVGRFA